MNNFSLFVISFFILSLTLNNKLVTKMEIKIISNVFKEGELIPSKYTCDGENISPQLGWNKPDERIKSFAIIMDDPDAPSGDFVHWVVYNIPANVNEFLENITPTRNIPNGVMMGKNDFGKIGYGGPCPPSGTHRYFFKIFGLDTNLHLIETGINKKQLLKAMEGHIIADGCLIGKYSRKR